MLFSVKQQNIRKRRGIKLLATEKRRNQLASELIYHTPKYFPENLMAIAMKSTKVKMKKPIYIGLR